MANVSPEFAQVLRSGRDVFNARFSEAKHQFGELDPHAFLEFLRMKVDPLVTAVSRHGAEHTSPFVEAVYDVALSLVGQGLAGPKARTPHLDACFTHALPPLAHLVARSPHEVLATVCNAAHHIASIHGGRARQFVEGLMHLGPLVPDVPCLLSLGRVLAWLSGLAHFRGAALEELPRLPPELGRRTLGIDAHADIAAVLERLRADPWYEPASDSRRKQSWVGAFRGFGGLFSVPPRVTTTRGGLLVESGSDQWLLCADAFGATFHRATDSERKDAAPFRAPKGALRDVVNESRGQLVSLVELPDTVACTFSRSHALLLLPAPASG